MEAAASLPGPPAEGRRVEFHPTPLELFPRQTLCLAGGTHGWYPEARPETPNHGYDQWNEQRPKRGRPGEKKATPVVVTPAVVPAVVATAIATAIAAAIATAIAAAIAAEFATAVTAAVAVNGGSTGDVAGDLAVAMDATT